MRQDSFRLASFGLGSVGVARVGHHINRLPRPTHHCLRGFPHRLQTAIIGGVVGHLCTTISACSASTAACTL